MTSYVARTAYMDGIDYEHELGHASDGVRVYPSRDALNRHAGHNLTECGVAVVKIVFVRWAAEPKDMLS